MSLMLVKGARLTAWRQRVDIFNYNGVKQCQLLARKLRGLALLLGAVLVGLNRYTSISNVFA